MSERDDTTQKPPSLPSSSWICGGGRLYCCAAYTDKSQTDGSQLEGLTKNDMLHKRQFSDVSLGQEYDACNVPEDEEDQRDNVDLQIGNVGGSGALNQSEHDMLDSKVFMNPMTIFGGNLPRRGTNETAGSVVVWQPMSGQQHLSIRRSLKLPSAYQASLGQRPSLIQQPLHPFEQSSFSGVTSKRSRSSLQMEEVNVCKGESPSSDVLIKSYGRKMSQKSTKRKSNASKSSRKGTTQAATNVTSNTSPKTTSILRKSSSPGRLGGTNLKVNQRAQRRQFKNLNNNANNVEQTTHADSNQSLLTLNYKAAGVSPFSMHQRDSSDYQLVDMDSNQRPSLNQQLERLQVSSMKEIGAASMQELGTFKAVQSQAVIENPFEEDKVSLMQHGLRKKPQVAPRSRQNKRATGKKSKQALERKATAHFGNEDPIQHQDLSSSKFKPFQQSGISQLTTEPIIDLDVSPVGTMPDSVALPQQISFLGNNFDHQQMLTTEHNMSFPRFIANEGASQLQRRHRSAARQVKKTQFLVPSPERESKEQVLKAGEVYRFKPSFSSKALFIDRYLELTSTTLRYYARLPSYQTNKQPQFRIPLSQISEATWVEVPSEVTPGKQQGKVDLINKITKEREEKPMLCFEVLLKDDYESLHLLDQVSGVLSKQEQVKQVRARTKSRKPRQLRLDQSAQELELNLSRIQLASPVSVEQTRTIRKVHEQNEYGSSLIKLKAGKVKVSVERSDSPIDPTEVVIKRVISSKHKSLKQRLMEESNFRRSTSQPKLIKTNRVVQGHAIAVRDSSRGRPMLHYVENGKILEKEFGKAITKGQRKVKEKHSWTSKQRDFFNGERRFIFGVKQASKGQAWINAINKAVASYQEPEPPSARRKAYRQATEHIESSLFDQQRAIEDLTTLLNQQQDTDPDRTTPDGPSDQIQRMLQYSLNYQNNMNDENEDVADSEEENVMSDSDGPRTGAFQEPRRSMNELNVHSATTNKSFQTFDLRQTKRTRDTTEVAQGQTYQSPDGLNLQMMLSQDQISDCGKPGDVEMMLSQN